MLTLVLVVVAAALIFEYINGFHDTANSIATSVRSWAITKPYDLRLSPSRATMIFQYFCGILMLTAPRSSTPAKSGSLSLSTGPAKTQYRSVAACFSTISSSAPQLSRRFDRLNPAVWGEQLVTK